MHRYYQAGVGVENERALAVAAAAHFAAAHPVHAHAPTHVLLASYVPFDLWDNQGRRPPELSRVSATWLLDDVVRLSPRGLVTDALRGAASEYILSPDGGAALDLDSPGVRIGRPALGNALVTAAVLGRCRFDFSSGVRLYMHGRRECCYLTESQDGAWEKRFDPCPLASPLVPPAPPVPPTSPLIEAALPYAGGTDVVVTTRDGSVSHHVARGDLATFTESARHGWMLRYTTDEETEEEGETVSESVAAAAARLLGSAGTPVLPYTSPISEGLRAEGDPIGDSIGDFLDGVAGVEFGGRVVSAADVIWGRAWLLDGGRRLARLADALLPRTQFAQRVMLSPRRDSAARNVLRVLATSPYLSPVARVVGASTLLRLLGDDVDYVMRLFLSPHGSQRHLEAQVSNLWQIRAPEESTRLSVDFESMSSTLDLVAPWFASLRIDRTLCVPVSAVMPTAAARWTTVVMTMLLLSAYPLGTCAYVGDVFFPEPDGQGDYQHSRPLLQLGDALLAAKASTASASLITVTMHRPRFGGGFIRGVLLLRLGRVEWFCQFGENEFIADALRQARAEGMFVPMVTTSGLEFASRRRDVDATFWFVRMALAMSEFPFYLARLCSGDPLRFLNEADRIESVLFSEADAAMRAYHAKLVRIVEARLQG